MYLYSSFKNEKVSLIPFKWEDHRDPEGGGYHLEKSNSPLTTMKLSEWAIFEKITQANF